MSLEHAILGFLQYHPLSGYDLKKVFDASVRHFWPADQAQIYRSLARLAEQGWASPEKIEQEVRPDRKVYHITDAGRAELRAWLALPLPPADHRSAELVQVFFAGQLSDHEILAIFERAAEQTRAMLEHYGRLPREPSAYASVVGSPRELYCWLLTLDCGVAGAECQLAWLEGVIARIKNGEIPER